MLRYCGNCCATSFFLASHVSLLATASQLAIRVYA